MNYASRGGVDAVIPVDVYVPGMSPQARRRCSTESYWRWAGAREVVPASAGSLGDFRTLSHHRDSRRIRRLFGKRGFPRQLRDRDAAMEKQSAENRVLADFLAKKRGYSISSCIPSCGRHGAWGIDANRPRAVCCSIALCPS